MKKILKKEYLFYLIIIAIFFTLATIVSLKHEYWPDELNAWLIAKDSSVIELFTKYLRNDGHPALFHLIIKTFQFFGLQLRDFRIISLLFSTLGVAVFVFKSKFKWYLKALFPFTFFIFFQYTVTTRGYCLLLLLVSLIASIWDEKYEKPILYTILLILLLSLETYTTLLAGSLYLLWLMHYIQDYKKNKKHDKKTLACFIILFLSFLFTAYYVLPRFSSSYLPTFVTSFSLSKIFIINFITNPIIVGITSIALIIYFLLIFSKKKENLVEALVILIPVILYMVFCYCSPWHYGILLVIFIFIFWIQKTNILHLNIFLLIVCLVQITWSINANIYDYKELHSSSEQVANFIKQYDYKNLKIFGQTYYELGPNAYFDKNIYYNWDDDVRFFYANKDNKYFNYETDTESILSYEPDIVLSSSGIYKKYKLNKKLMKEKYDLYEFKAYTYFEVKPFQNLTTEVYVKKGLVK